MNTRDNRRHRRIPCLAPVRISWEDEGQPCFAAVKCIDLSENGMRVEVMRQVRPGARLLIAAERLKFNGSASVRNAQRYGGKYLLGLQFSQDLSAAKIAELEASL